MGDVTATQVRNDLIAITDGIDNAFETLVPIGSSLVGFAIITYIIYKLIFG